MRSWHHFMQANPPLQSQGSQTVIMLGLLPSRLNTLRLCTLHILKFLQWTRTSSWSWTKIWSMSLSVSKFDDKFVNLNERWMIHEIFCHKSVKFELTYGSCPKKQFRQSWIFSEYEPDPPESTGLKKCAILWKLAKYHFHRLMISRKFNRLPNRV